MLIQNFKLEQTIKVNEDEDKEQKILKSFIYVEELISFIGFDPCSYDIKLICNQENEYKEFEIINKKINKYKNFQHITNLINIKKIS